MEENKRSKKQIVQKLLNNTNENLDEKELLELLIDEPLSVNVEKLDRETRTKGDIVADKLTQLAGSWGFIISFSIFLIIWILLNLFVFKNLDPYPFILLNLLLSCLAALQAPIIMMSQNREAKKESLKSLNDYKTDLKSELILEEIHDKMGKILANQYKINQKLEELENEKNR